VADASGFDCGVVRSSICFFSGSPVSSKSSSRWFSVTERERRLSTSALAFTLVESKNSSSPHTSLALKHSSTIFSKKRLNTSSP
jgi:hypothetical protein